jgi:hypothetical protein
MTQGHDTKGERSTIGRSLGRNSATPRRPKAWFDAVDANPFHQGLLSALRSYAP